MIINVKDLKKGDTILIACQVDFKMLKLINDIKLDKNGFVKRVKCAIQNNRLNQKYSLYVCDSNYNDTISMDLGCRKIWLISRETEKII
jgi:hypothetical protein